MFCSFSALLALAVFTASLGIDFHAILADPGLAFSAPGRFIPIGPRRFPPGYRKLAFARPLEIRDHKGTEAN